jgi:hypothetical protein
LCGHVLLLVIAAVMLRDGQGAFSLHSLAFWMLTALLIVARRVDLVAFDGGAVAGEYGKAPSLRRYALMLVVVAAALWTAAVALGS